MSIDNQQETQEIENTETPEAAETISATTEEKTAKELEIVVDENKEEEISSQKEDVQDIVVAEELDKSEYEEDIPGKHTRRARVPRK